MYRIYALFESVMQVGVTVKFNIRVFVRETLICYHSPGLNPFFFIFGREKAQLSVSSYVEKKALTSAFLPLTMPPPLRSTSSNKASELKWFWWGHEIQE